MCKKLVVMVVAVVVVVVVVMSMCGTGYYTLEDCAVIQVEGQTVYAEDSQGNVWCYEAEGTAPSTGTAIDLYMYTNNTHSYTYDDEVVGVIHLQ